MLLDKIKKALGELADQVDTALKAAGIEVGVTNDGTLVPAGKHEDLKRDYETLKTTATENANKVTSLTTDLDKIKGEFNTYKDNVAKGETKSKKAKALEAKLRDAKAAPDALDLLIQSTDLDKLELDDKGELTGVDEIINGYKTSRPSLFGKDITESKKTPPDGKPAGVKYTMDQIKAMSQEEVNANLDDVLASMESQ